MYVCVSPRLRCTAAVQVSRWSPLSGCFFVDGALRSRVTLSVVTQRATAICAVTPGEDGREVGGQLSRHSCASQRRHTCVTGAVACRAVRV